MAFNREFIVDQVLTHDQIDDMQNVIAVIKARWKITHSDYPNGFAYHAFNKYYYEGDFDLDNFIPIEDVTDAILEQWVTSSMVPDTVNEIYVAAMPLIRAKDAEHGLTIHFQNPEALPPV